MSMTNAQLEAAMRAALVRLTNALANRDAPNSLKLDGKTLTEITALILAGTAANSNQLEGQTLAQIIASVSGGTASSIKTVEDALNAFIARRDNPHAVTKAQVGLSDVQNYGVATQAEAEAGATNKYVTADMAKHLAQIAVDSLVGASPETLNTIQEIAAALQNDPDIINTLMTEIGTKETPAGAQAKADQAEADAIAAAASYTDTQIAAAGTTAQAAADQAEADANAYTDSQIAANVVRAVQAEAEAGVDNIKLMTPATTSQAIAFQGAALFLGKTAQAADSAMLGGKTLAQVMADVATAVSTGTSANSGMLEGKTLAEVIALAQAGVDMSNVVLKTDNFGQYLVDGSTLSSVLAGLSADLDAFIANKASGAEAIAGTDDSKYITALSLKAKVDDAINGLVGAAPETLNTINELAAALNNDPDVINNLMSQIGTKTTLAQVQAEIATALTPIDSRLDALEAAIGGGSNFMQTGVTDLGTNPVALAGDVGEPLTLKAILEAGKVTDANLGTQISDLAASTTSAIAAAQATLSGDIATVQGNLDAAVGALQAADSGLDARIDALEAAAPDLQTKTGSLDQNTVLDGGSQVLLTTVLANLKAYADSIGAGADADLAALQSSFNAFVAAKASGAEVIAGTDDVKYTTSVSVKAAINAAIQELAGTAPEALNTINELAAALNNDPDIINQLMTQISGKLGATETAADSAKLGGVAAADYALKTYVDDGDANILETMTEGFIANALDLAPMYNGTITVADLGGGSYGFGASGSMSPASFDGKTILGLSWNGATAVLKLQGDQTALTIDALMINGQVLNAFVSRALNGSDTDYTFTVDKVLPTTGSVPAKF